MPNDPYYFQMIIGYISLKSMIEGEQCACGWQPTEAQRKQMIETNYWTWYTVFIEHLQEKHALPPQFTGEQFHTLLDFLEKKYHK